MKHIMQILQKYKIKIVLIIIFTFSEMLFTLLLPLFISRIIQIGTTTKNFNFIVLYLFLMIVSCLLALLSALISVKNISIINSGFSYDLRTKLFKKIINLKKQDRIGLSNSSNITRTVNDVQQLQTTLSMILRMGILAPIITVSGLIISYINQPKLTLILFFTSILLSFIIVFVGRIMMPLNKKNQTLIDKLNLLSKEMLTGLKTIRSFNRQIYEEKKFGDINNSLYKTAIKINKYSSFLMPISMLIMNMYMVITIFYGGNLIVSGEMNPSDIVAFMQYGIQILFGFIMLSVVFMFIPRAGVSIKRINEVLDIKEKIKDNINAEIISNIRNIKFNKVCFKIGESEKFILKNINFEMNEGECIGVIGPIGSGKTTIINLLLRYFDVTNGEILINNINIKELDINSLINNISYVSQNPIVFEGSIKYNLEYGKKEVKDKEMYDILEKVDLLDFVNDKEEKLDYEINPLGKNLSGGQKQRISIARALLKKSSVYLLDDCFSSLDFKVTKKILKNIREETKGKILFLISQRIYNIEFCDKIIVLDEGKILDVGSHRELLQKSQVYKELYDSQTSKDGERIKWYEK